VRQEPQKRHLVDIHFVFNLFIFCTLVNYQVLLRKSHDFIDSHWDRIISIGQFILRQGDSPCPPCERRAGCVPIIEIVV
jgi:hypothetical protein